MQIMASANKNKCFSKRFCPYSPQLIIINNSNLLVLQSFTSFQNFHWSYGFSITPASVCNDFRSVHATTEDFENGGFTLKTYQMFCVHTTQEEFKLKARFKNVFRPPSLLKCGLGWEMLGDISYHKATLQSEIKHSIHWRAPYLSFQ